MVVAAGEEAEAAGAEVVEADEEIAVVVAVIAVEGSAAGAAGAVLAAEVDAASDGRPLSAASAASHRHGSTLALVLLPVLCVPATHVGQNQSRRVT